MTWISEKDKGIYDAMNKGLTLATGDIVGIINADDFYIRNTVIQEIVDHLIHSSKDSVFSDVRIVSALNVNKQLRYYSSGYFSPKHFKYGMMPAHCTFFTYRSNYMKYGMFRSDYKIAADFDLLFRFLYRHKLSYSYLPSALIVMREGGVSTASWKSNVLLNREILNTCRENGIKTYSGLILLKYLFKVFELFRRSK